MTLRGQCRFPLASRRCGGGTVNCVIVCLCLCQIVGGTRWPAAHDKAGDIKKTLRLLITYIQAQIEIVGNSDNMQHMAPPTEAAYVTVDGGWLFYAPSK